MTCIDPLTEALKEVDTTYTVRVGPYTHKVDRKTGRHEVISKEAKQPQAYYWDKEGCLHITTVDLKLAPQPE